ncbi:MAG: response regulator transcription factor [Bacteroidetes bacterium]|nr:response regulator transcription factor [Bacteroidota bacterium]
MIRALIVDDEKKSRELLLALLNRHCPEVFVAGLASNNTEAYDLICLQKPDVVFLDIRMQGGSGFDLLKKFREVNFLVIFITAYDQYALRAIKYSALDYLLKPVDENELKEAVAKAVQNMSLRNYRPHIDNLLTHLKNPDNPANKIAIHSSGTIELIPIRHITRCEADGKYTRIFLSDGTHRLASRNLKEYEELLSGFGFYRVHHAHLVNFTCIKEYERGRGGNLILNDGTSITVSQRKKAEFLRVLKTRD